MTEGSREDQVLMVSTHAILIIKGLE